MFYPQTSKRIKVSTLWHVNINVVKLEFPKFKTKIQYKYNSRNLLPLKFQFPEVDLPAPYPYIYLFPDLRHIVWPENNKMDNEKIELLFSNSTFS